MDCEERLLSMQNDIRQIGDLIREALTQVHCDFPFTRIQASRYLGCNPRTIDNYRRRGLLTLVTKDGMIGYMKTDLDKLKK